MENDVFTYLDEKYRYLNNYIRDFNKALFSSPNEAMIKGRMFAERLTQEIAILEKVNFSSRFVTQDERIKVLRRKGVFDEHIEKLFNNIRLIGNKVAHVGVEAELEEALRMNRIIYKIVCWFIKEYIDHNFKSEPYKSPMPSTESNPSIDINSIEEIIKKTMINVIDKQSLNENMNSNPDDIKKDKEMEEANTDLLVESIFNEEPNKKCLVQELARLKESSKEAVEGLGDFTPFKTYMHIVRDVQDELENLIIESSKSEKAQLILVCGSVGDGKSHIISYFNNKLPDIMKNFTLHNDATESLEPSKTSMDTLNDVLDEFSDEKIDTSNKKFILAINLGTLNNFIDSQYGERFSKLKVFVQKKKILETNIEDSSFDENSSFQFVNFSDYHMFTLENGQSKSNYVKSILQKITKSYEVNFNETNIFYSSYKINCSKCDNFNCCPIKANYELLSKENVQNSIVDLLVQCIVKDKIIISTRALLNFIYELIVPRSYIDVNSPTFKNRISSLNSSEYIMSLMPNIIFNHRELSTIFESLNNIDPLNIRNAKVDDFIIDFNNTTDIMKYFEEYIDYPKGYIEKINAINPVETEYKNLKTELLKLFIRSYLICGIGNLLSLRDEIYDEYISALFYWNKGDKAKLKNVYNNVKNGIINWNGEADKDNINIFVGKNQNKYKISERIQLKADTSNLNKFNENDLKKFISNLILQFKDENGDNTYKIDIDYNLYKLLLQVNNGYRPNKKDKNHFIKFIEFINKLEETGSQNELIIFTEKNREKNGKYKLEFDQEFETFRFMEI